MLMSEIIQRFRDENPEMDANVIPDVTCQSWLTIGESEVATKCRLINTQDNVIVPVVGQRDYDLTLTDSSFLDIDENPGGGINAWYNVGNTQYKRLTKQTKAWLDSNNSAWRTAASGKPLYYYRYGKNICLYPTPDSTVTQITADLILLTTPFTNLNQTPFNALPYLANFHYVLVLYLTWRGKTKIGKDQEAMSAYNLMGAYTAWMVKTLGGGKYGSIEFRPTGLPYIGYNR